MSPHEISQCIWSEVARNKSKLKVQNCMRFSTERLKYCRSTEHCRCELVINSVRFRRQVQQHQHLQHAVISIHKHITGTVTLQWIVIMLGKDQKPNKNFSLKVLAGKQLHNQVVFVSIFENHGEKKSSKLDGDERLLQDSPFTTEHHSCEAKAFQFTKTAA